MPNLPSHIFAKDYKGLIKEGGWCVPLQSGGGGAPHLNNDEAKWAIFGTAQSAGPQNLPQIPSAVTPLGFAFAAETTSQKIAWGKHENERKGIQKDSEKRYFTRILTHIPSKFPWTIMLQAGHQASFGICSCGTEVTLLPWLFEGRKRRLAQLPFTPEQVPSPVERTLTPPQKNTFVHTVHPPACGCAHARMGVDTCTHSFPWALKGWPMAKVRIQRKWHLGGWSNDLAIGPPKFFFEGMPLKDRPLATGLTPVWGSNRSENVDF